MKTMYYKELVEELPIKIMDCRNSVVTEHKHAFLELVYVCHGKAEHIFAKQSAIVQKGDFFLIDLNCSHEYRRIGNDDSFRIINCLFLPRFLDEALPDDADFQALSKSLASQVEGECSADSSARKIFHDDTGMMELLTETMLREFEAKKAGYVAVIRHLLTTALIQVLRNENPNEGDSTTKLIRRIHAYVEEHYASPLLLSDIAKMLSFSVPYVSTIFRRECGVTFREYLIRVRIEKACHLLRSNHQTLREIAEQVGYTDPAFFYKAFRREMDMTPDEYRRHHGMTFLERSEQ